MPRKVREQIRTGEMLTCKKCGDEYYATPSRAKRNKATGGGYCGEDCAYEDRRAKRGQCKLDGCTNGVKHPSVFCSRGHYWEDRRAKADAESPRPKSSEPAQT